jgi:hypothetical protein
VTHTGQKPDLALTAHVGIKYRWGMIYFTTHHTGEKLVRPFAAAVDKRAALIFRMKYLTNNFIGVEEMKNQDKTYRIESYLDAAVNLKYRILSYSDHFHAWVEVARNLGSILEGEEAIITQLKEKQDHLKWIAEVERINGKDQNV